MKTAFKLLASILLVLSPHIKAQNLCVDYFSALQLKNVNGRISEGRNSWATFIEDIKKIDEEISVLIKLQETLSSRNIEYRKYYFGKIRDIKTPHDEVVTLTAQIDGIVKKYYEDRSILERKIEELTQNRLESIIQFYLLLPEISKEEIEADSLHVWRGTLLRRLKLRIEGASQLYIENLYYEGPNKITLGMPIDFTGIHNKSISYNFALEGFAVDSLQGKDRIDAIVIAVPLKAAPYLAPHTSERASKLTIPQDYLNNIKGVQIYRVKRDNP